NEIGNDPTPFIKPFFHDVNWFFLYLEETLNLLLEPEARIEDLRHLFYGSYHDSLERRLEVAKGQLQRRAELKRRRVLARDKKVLLQNKERERTAGGAELKSRRSFSWKNQETNLPGRGVVPREVEAVADQHLLQGGDHLPSEGNEIDFRGRTSGATRGSCSSSYSLVGSHPGGEAARADVNVPFPPGDENNYPFRVVAQELMHLCPGLPLGHGCENRAELDLLLEQKELLQLPGGPSTTTQPMLEGFCLPRITLLPWTEMLVQQPVDDTDRSTCEGEHDLLVTSGTTQRDHDLPPCSTSFIGRRPARGGHARHTHEYVTGEIASKIQRLCRRARELDRNSCARMLQ
ncbi:unnamed protein product, partial [Amoebophrya sp. A120]